MAEDIKVLIVDDSPFMRELLSNLITKDPMLKVVGKARDGEDALKMVRELAPDVITMDIEMPKMDGLLALEEIIKIRPTPVIMLSSFTQAGAEATLKALDKGAIDFIGKPSGLQPVNLVGLQNELIDKINAAARAKLHHHLPRHHLPEHQEFPNRQPQTIISKSPARRATGQLRNLVAIGTSTGGPKALQAIIPYLPEEIPAGILIVQHMPPDFTRSLAQRLDTMSKIRVKEAQDGDEIEPGLALVAPGDFHMTVVKSTGGKYTVSLNKEPPMSGHRPSVDIMMNSVAEQKIPLVGVLLTGMGSDGAEGLLKIKGSGGHTIAEDQSTAVIFGMPRVAIEKKAAEKILPLPQIAMEINKFMK